MIKYVLVSESLDLTIYGELKNVRLGSTAARDACVDNDIDGHGDGLPDRDGWERIWSYRPNMVPHVTGWKFMLIEVDGVPIDYSRKESGDACVPVHPDGTDHRHF